MIYLKKKSSEERQSPQRVRDAIRRRKLFRTAADFDSAEFEVLATNA